MAKKVNSSGGFLHYWGKQAHYTSLVHTALGVGIGLLVSPYLAASGIAHVIGWVLVLLVVLSHLYALVS